MANILDQFSLEGKTALVARSDLSETASAVEATGTKALCLNEDLGDKSVTSKKHSTHP